MVIRAKTRSLFEGRQLTDKQIVNSLINLSELDEQRAVLKSYPRRLVFELTNVCNLNCIMCGRNAAKFAPTFFRMDTFLRFEPLMDYVEEVTLMGWGEPTINPDFIKMLETIDRHAARKYFCTNGMNLRRIREAIFKHRVDVFAVSLDGATGLTNARIRKGSDLHAIINELSEIIRERNRRGLDYPYINLVFCAMKSNIAELPDLVRLAADIGIDEVKVVYLTVFAEGLLHESLWGEEELVRRYFLEAEALGDSLGVYIKLPHIIGEDPSGNRGHKDCFVAWRDFFLGSDGYVRPCMSTPIKFFKFDESMNFMDMWNSGEFIDFRNNINSYETGTAPCKRCYQSSYCNWNRRESFIQIGEAFSPEWADN
jgi:radical SAM protein with 4Fe4S-binding SPASM domain